MESLDSLPYVDAPVTEEERRQIYKSIAAELPAGYQKKPHPSLLPIPESKFTPLMQAEVDRKARGESTEVGVDMSRYEAPDQPVDGEDSAWRASLKAACRSTTYLEGRHVNLSLLEEYGKNAWLIANSQLEELLQQMERVLKNLKEQTENINKARKGAQEDSRGELLGLEDSWRSGIGKIIEVQAATSGLRQEILRRRRVH